MTTSIFNKKIWILNLCLLSFFINTSYSYTPEFDKYDNFQKDMIIAFSSFLGLCFYFSGMEIMMSGKNRQDDLPTTANERSFFVLRNFLPKEDLERIKAQDQIIAIKEIKVGKILLSLGTLCFAGGVITAYLDEIIAAITKKTDH